MLGRIQEQVGTTDAAGFTDLREYRVRVDEWIVRSGANSVTIVSSPPGCADAPYLSGEYFADAAAEGLTVAVFAVRDDSGALIGLAPGRQVIVLGPDGAIPDTWPKP